MKKTINHPLIVAYLESLTHAAEPLTPEQRDELRADLEEHIAVALAGRTNPSDQEVEAVLDRLGDPDTIVATSGEYEERVRKVSKWHSCAPLILLPTSGLLLGFSLLLSGLTLMVGLVLLWTAPHWGTREKVTGTAAALIAPLGIALVGIVFAGMDRINVAALLVCTLALTAVPIGASIYLFREGRRTTT